MQPWRIKGLYAVTPDVDDNSYLATKTHQALAGGAQLVQYRNKKATCVQRLEQAGFLARLCRKFHAPLIINDHLELAIEIDAAGVHLGQEDIPLPEARRRLGNKKIIGISCYNRLDLAIQAEREGANYVAFGAFFTSFTKPEAAAISDDLLSRAKRSLHIPIIAIGGITHTNAEFLIDRGADSIAASYSLYNVTDSRLAAKKFSQLFNRTDPVSHNSEKLIWPH